MSVEIVAEIGNSHGGVLSRAIRLIDAAKAAGVDTCKFQAYSSAELVGLRGNGPAPEPWGSRGYSMRDLYEKAQTPLAWFPALAAHCESVGMPWFSSVFGAESLKVLEDCGCPRYKLAALDYAAGWLRDLVRATGKPLVISHGGGPFADADIPGDTYLWCPKSYPQTTYSLSTIQMRGYDGFSYHGTDALVPVVAVAAGARIVEFHFHLYDEPNELEASCCLDENETYIMVDQIRDVESWL